MSTPAQNRVVFLDGLRAIATVAVLMQHYLEIVAHETFLPFLQFAPGVFGVVLFFFVSGYVIPFSVKNGLQPAAFLMRRVFRIFPLFICVLTAVIALGLMGIEPFSGRLARLGGFDYVANYLLIFEYVRAPSVLGVAWTLSVEFAWYAFFLVYFLQFGHRRVAEASILFSVAMIGMVIICMSLDMRAPLGRFGMIGAALIGYVFCCWHLRLIEGRYVGLAVSAFACATALSQWMSFGYFAHPNITLFSGMTAWMLALGLFVIIATFARIHRSTIWMHPTVQTLGRLSFGIYLIHMPVFLLLANILSGAILVATATGLTFVLSEIAYRYIEVPGNTFGTRKVWRTRPA